jgi:hypothetical protein
MLESSSLDLQSILEKTEREMKNGQFRDTGNIGHKTQKTKRQTNKINTKHTEH